MRKARYGFVHMATVVLLGGFLLSPAVGGSSVDTAAIQIQSIGLAPLATSAGCFRVDLGFTVETRERGSLDLAYRWKQDYFPIIGLSDRTVRTRGSGPIFVSESFTVCPIEDLGNVSLMTLDIQASRSGERYRAHPNISFVRNYADWDHPSRAQVLNLKSGITDGMARPEILQRYWRAVSAYHDGGYAVFDRRAGQRIDDDVATWPVRPTAAALSAYKRIVRVNGGFVDVAFDRLSGEVVSLVLNNAYRVSVDGYESDLAQLLSSGLIADLIGYRPGLDRLELINKKDTPQGLRLFYRRSITERETGAQIPVVPDHLTVSLNKRDLGGSGDLYVVSTVDVSYGPVGRATCDKADRRLLDANDLSLEEHMSNVRARTILKRSGRSYHCVYEWVADFENPDNSGSYPYIRMVDAQSGEVLVNGALLIGDGSKSDDHHFEISLTVPYKRPAKTLSNAASSYSHTFQEWVTLPLGTVRAYAPPDGLQFESHAIDVARWSTFLPIRIPIIGDTTMDHEGFRYLYDFYYLHDPNTQAFGFYPGDANICQGDYYDSWHNMTWSDFAQDTDLAPGGHPKPPSASSHDFALYYDLGWYWDDQPNVSNNQKVIAYTAEAYFLIQYAKYLWWSGTWSDPPWTHCANDWEVRFYVKNHPACTAAACARWAPLIGGQTIYAYLDHCGQRSIPGMSHTIPPHEFGHWMGNVYAPSYGPNGRPRAARMEGIADYYAFSLKANWDTDVILDSWLAGEGLGGVSYASGDPERRYHGGKFYLSMSHDRDLGELYRNSVVWSTGYLQLMNTMGNFWTDRLVGESYFDGAADTMPWDCYDTHSDFVYDSLDDQKDAYRAAQTQGSQMFSWDRDHDRFYAPEFVYRQSQAVEIQDMMRKRNWHHGYDNNSAKKRHHNVSQTPSFAHSLTLSSNDPKAVWVWFDAVFDTKWVNFYALANVKYSIATRGTSDTRLTLHHAEAASTSQGPNVYPLPLASNDECDGITITAPPGSTKVTIAQNDPTTDCQLLGVQSRIEFTPRKSGWYYAAASAEGSSSHATMIYLAPEQTQVATTSAGSNPDHFTPDIEQRMGVSVPVTMPSEDPSSTGTSVDGEFTVAREDHYYRFQYSSVRRIRILGSEKAPGMVTRANQLEMEYIVSIERPNDNSILEVTLSVDDEVPNSSDPAIPLKRLLSLNDLGLVTRVSSPTPAGFLKEEFHINTADLFNHPQVDMWNGKNIYVHLRRVAGGPRVRAAYEIWVQSDQGNLPPLLADGVGVEDDSNIVNPFLIDRWCANESERIECTFDSFSVNERLSPSDGDFYQIWLQEGEHLNVTYRGRVPAAIDVDGPSAIEDPVTGETIVYASANSWINKNREHKYRVKKPEHGIPDWRPFLVDSKVLRCQDQTSTHPIQCPDQEYFAERGYLWAYNKCSHAQWELWQMNPTPGSWTIECYAPEDKNITVPIGTDNTLHLPLTAYVTGLYTIRVRTQRRDDDQVFLDGFWEWDFFSGYGSPYSLDFNIGVLKNKNRPHWQMFQDADPTPRVRCGQYD